MIRVLIVDDDFMVAKIHTGFVERTPGFQVVGAAHTGVSALTECARTRPDLVLLDVYLPDTTGLELLQGMREIVPDVDVLVISAAREADTVRRALRGGVVHYLIKPFSYEDLRVRLEHYRQAHRGLAASEQTDQAEVDRVFGTGRPDIRLPKGLSAETLHLVEQGLRESGEDLSAAELAEKLGMSRVSARRYLEHLVATERAEVRLRYGEVGRPERRYQCR